MLRNIGLTLSTSACDVGYKNPMLLTHPSDEALIKTSSVFHPGDIRGWGSSGWTAQYQLLAGGHCNIDTVIKLVVCPVRRPD